MWREKNRKEYIWLKEEKKNCRKTRLFSFGARSCLTVLFV